MAQRTIRWKCGGWDKYARVFPDPEGERRICLDIGQHEEHPPIGAARKLAEGILAICDVVEKKAAKAARKE